MTEVTKIDKVENNYGTCPFQSGFPVPANVGSSLSVNPNAMQIAFSQVFCSGGQCQLWDATCAQCSLKSVPGGIADLLEDRLLSSIERMEGHLSTIAAHLANLEPPKGGPSPTMRIADAIEVIARQSEKGGTPSKKT